MQLPEFWPGQSVNGAGPTEEARSSQGGGDEDRRNRLQLSTQQLLKEAREEDWEDHPGPEPVELAFKKVSGDTRGSDPVCSAGQTDESVCRQVDGCPLGTWRGSVDVDAPQQELLLRLLREQHLWEEHLQHAAVLHALSEDTEVYRCVLQGRGPQPPQDHLLLRYRGPRRTSLSSFVSWTHVRTKRFCPPEPGRSAHT